MLVPLLVVFVLAWLFLPERQNDESGYLGLARNLLDGEYAKGPPDALLDEDLTYPDLWFGPGLPLVLTGPVAAGLPLELVRAIGPLVLFLAVLVFYQLMRRHVRPRAALAAAWTLGLYFPFYTLLPALHSEALAVLCVVVALYATARLEEDGGGAKWLALGAGALAGLALTRVEYGWVLTIVLAVMTGWWVVARTRRARQLAAMYALALLLCVPWLAYTASETGRAIQWGNSGGLSAYWMSSPYAGDLGDWQKAEDVFTNPNLAPHRRFFAELEGLALPEQNAELERRALANIRDRPLKYLENVAANVSRMFFDTPYSYSRQRLTALYFAVPNSILLAATLISAFIAVRVRRSLPAAAVPFAIFGASAFMLHVIVSAYPRMLMPIVPVVVWFAATTIANNVRLVSTTPQGRS
jgi:4-amino-4-deoxy-L-arabinose transferase-like glycosyltransferase